MAQFTPKTAAEPTIPAYEDAQPSGLGLVITGALAIALGTFLPFQESPRFREIEQNTLIQNPSGWVLIALALGIVVTGYRVGQGLSTKWWQPTLLSVGAALWVLLIATKKKPADPVSRWLQR